MLKNILNLKGAQKLTKTEQKSINGATMREVAPIACYCNGVLVYLAVTSCSQAVCQ